MYRYLEKFVEKLIYLLPKNISKISVQNKKGKGKIASVLYCTVLYRGEKPEE